MNHRTPAQAFADAASALVKSSDVTDTLSRLLRDCCTLLDADALGVLVRSPSGNLELLSASSHKTAALEAFQIQHEHGPCIDTIASGQPVVAVGAQEVRSAWPGVGAVILQTGFYAVHAFPMRFNGRTIGGLNLFHTDARTLDDEQTILGQAFADVATLVIVKSTDLSTGQIAARVKQALDGRTVIERAKGVLAHQYGLDMAAAYDFLLRLAEEDGADLTTVARNTLSSTQHRS